MVYDRMLWNIYGMEWLNRTNRNTFNIFMIRTFRIYS